jgi:hypothetical protein
MSEMILLVITMFIFVQERYVIIVIKIQVVQVALVGVGSSRGCGTMFAIIEIFNELHEGSLHALFEFHDSANVCFATVAFFIDCVAQLGRENGSCRIT